jgi:hypothetical protein
MIAPQIVAAAGRVGVPPVALYLRGRVAPMGSLTAPAAASVIGIFPPAFVAKLWGRTEGLSTKDALEAFAEACTSWGTEMLADVPAESLTQVASLGEKVIDSAELSALPLIAAWASVDRPVEVRGRAAFALFLLRELRGAVHLAALRAHGLDVPVAVLADPSAGESRLRTAFAWRDTDIAPVRARAAAVPDLASRWTSAEESTDVAFAAFLGVLTSSEGDELVQACDAVVSAVGA